MAMENKLSNVEGEIPEAVINELPFPCPSCEKSFGSGKALGGHKRVHLLQAKNESGQTSNVQIPNVDPHETLKCPICDQGFSSEKALHGHMRKHPDRTWRGMKPPSPTVEDSLADLGQEDDEMDSDDLLVNALQKTRTSHGKATMIQDSTQKKKKVDLLTASPNAGIKIGDEISLENPKPGPESSNKGKNKLIQRKIFVCTICNRRFKSYQALGGHKSHHGSNVNASGEEGASGTTATDATVKTVEEETKDQSAVVSFEFDLNELPPEEDD